MLSSHFFIFILALAEHGRNSHVSGIEPTWSPVEPLHPINLPFRSLENVARFARPTRHYIIYLYSTVIFLDIIILSSYSAIREKG